MEHLRGKFIAFDGGEGCGKSTQIRLLRDTLESKNIPVTLVHDPGTTRVGKLIRTILLDPANSDISMRCEMLLYMAARAQMMSEMIFPGVERRARRAVRSLRFQHAQLSAGRRRPDAGGNLQRR